MPIFPTPLPQFSTMPTNSFPRISSNGAMPSTSKMGSVKTTSNGTSSSSRPSTSHSSRIYKSSHKSERYRSTTSNTEVFCVALPPTITRKELKKSKILQTQKEKAARGKLLEATIEQLSQVARFQIHKKNSEVAKSIFHSVEMLAESG
uniref:BHLH domain-containing protein n=1 Tax=Acrobeloides nanus TaxID=290746 RepID=A0A914DPH8_9BILA